VGWDQLGSPSFGDETYVFDRTGNVTPPNATAVTVVDADTIQLTLPMGALPSTIVWAP